MNRQISTFSRPLITLAAIGLLVAACSTAASPSPRATASVAPPTASPSLAASPSEAPTSGPSAGASAAPSDGASAAAVAITTATTPLGTVLVGPSGMTLYIRTTDGTTGGPSTCSGACLAAWPPLTVAGVTQLSADANVSTGLSTFVRDDGASQVVYLGRPLYYFAADKVAGDTTGQGVGGVWFVALATGNSDAGAPAASPAY